MTREKKDGTWAHQKDNREKNRGNIKNVGNQRNRYHKVIFLEHIFFYKSHKQTCSKNTSSKNE